MRVVYVEWIDSNTTRGWYAKDTDGPSMIRSIGFELHRTKDFIVLTTSESSGGRYLDQLAIPMCAVKKITLIRRGT